MYSLYVHYTVFWFYFSLLTRFFLLSILCKEPETCLSFLSSNAWKRLVALSATGMREGATPPTDRCGLPWLYTAAHIDHITTTFHMCFDDPIEVTFPMNTSYQPG